MFMCNKKCQTLFCMPLCHQYYLSYSLASQKYKVLILLMIAVKKIEIPFISPLEKARQQRLSGHLQYSLSDCFISYLTIQDQRLYFNKYDQHVTVADIAVQFSEINNGQQLKLQTEEFAIDPTMPVAELTSTLQKKEVFEKVLNNVAQNKDPIKEIKKPEEKKLAEDIVFIVKKHNQKIQQTKEFQSHQCLIQLKERPQCGKTTLKYFVTETTTLNEIAEKINQEAGNQISIVFVETANKITYSRNQFSKPFSQLRMNSKQLIFSYLPVLTLGKTQKLKVKLSNSFNDRQAVQIKVKKEDTILVILKTVKSLIKNEDDPLQIKDSENNTIEQEKWNVPLDSLFFRKFMLQFVYPAFLSYDCRIAVVNHPGKPISLTFPIQKNTTFNHIISYVREQIRYKNAHFKIYDAKGKSYGADYRNKKLFSLQIQEEYFKFQFIKPRCMVSSQTKIIVKLPQKQQYQQIPVRQLVQLQNLSQIQILSYNQQKHLMQLAKITCFRKQAGFARLHEIQLAGDDQLVTVHCFSDSMFITQNFQWKPASMHRKGEKVMMARSDLQTVHYAQILNVKQIGVDQQQELYTLQVSPSHNFLANRVIMHNDESITITAHFYSENQPVKTQEIKCYIYDKLEQVKAFKSKKLMLGGLPLKSNLTFGDYQIYNFGTIFVLDQNYKQKSQDFIISEWREESCRYDQVNVMQKNKWITDCLGLRQSKIVELKESQLNLKNHNRPQHLLVSPKVHLQKLHYIYNIAPQYQRYQQNILKNVFRPQLLGQQSFKLKFEELLAEKEKVLAKQLQILPVYLYTTNLVYKQLNIFLRQSGKNRAADQYRKWYSLTNSLLKSLNKLPKLEHKTLYRGISNISIKDAFSRRENKDKQSYLLLNSFTSTTTDKEVALAFITGKGALLTIKTSSGKSISDYSQYRDEDQILLPPFLYFRITKFDPDSEVQQLELEEIPFPKTTKNKLIFWVDDMPVNNRPIIEQHFETTDIEVVQVLSTSIMKIILRDFFGVLQAMGKQIVIISDMTRYQDGEWNSQAGVDLFNLIYKEYGMSNKAIIYTMDQNRALTAIKQRGINPGKWSVLVDSDEIVTQVKAEFSK